MFVSFCPFFSHDLSYYPYFLSIFCLFYLLTTLRKLFEFLRFFFYKTNLIWNGVIRLCLRQNYFYLNNWVRSSSYWPTSFSDALLRKFISTNWPHFTPDSLSRNAVNLSEMSLNYECCFFAFLVFYTNLSYCGLHYFQLFCIKSWIYPRIYK